MKFSLLRKKRIENRNKEKTIDEVETKSKRDFYLATLPILATASYLVSLWHAVNL